MYFYVQELKTKRKIKGTPKEIISGKKEVDGILVNTYEFSKECFDREIRKAYRITLHESYREKGKVKKREYAFCTLNYYDIAESYGDELLDFDSLYYKLLEKLDDVIAKISIDKEKESDLRDHLQESLSEKWDNLFVPIIEEFSKTKEGKIFLKHKQTIYKYKENKSKFLETYDAFSQEYDVCYNLYGELTNPVYLEKIKARSSHRREERSNYNSYRGSSNTSYTEDQRKMLKQFYRILGKNLHPDSNHGVDTNEQMKFLNKLKEDWGV